MRGKYTRRNSRSQFRTTAIPFTDHARIFHTMYTDTRASLAFLFSTLYRLIQANYANIPWTHSVTFHREAWTTERRSAAPNLHRSASLTINPRARLALRATVRVQIYFREVEPSVRLRSRSGQTRRRREGEPFDTAPRKGVRIGGTG